MKKTESLRNLAQHPCFICKETKAQKEKLLAQEHKVCVCECRPARFLEFRWWYSVAKLYLPLFDPMDCSTPGFPVLHYPQSLLKFMST